MKILVLAPQPFFRVRGTPINVRNLVSALAEAGHEVDLLAYPFGDDVEIPGVKIFRSLRFPGVKDIPVGPSWQKILLDTLLPLTAFRLCLRKRYGAIHAVEESVFIGLALKFIFRTRLVYDMDSHISDQLEYSRFLKSRLLLGLVRRLETFAVRRCDCIVTVCRSLTDSARSIAGGVPIVQIEDAPLEESFVPQNEKAAELRAAHGLSDRKVIVYTGNFEEYQGIELLLESVPQVLSSFPRAAFVLVGGDPQHVEVMRRKAGELGISQHVVFAGRKPPHEIPAYLTLADVLVAPRVKGTNTAHKIYGYMQSGKPIVATKLETHTQVLNDECAILVEPDARHFAEGLIKALSNPEGLLSLGKKAAELINRHYSLSAFRRKVKESYMIFERGI